MITLYTFAAGFGEFSYSPFCTKAAYLLNMAGAAWQREDMNDPRKMPYGKLPALKTAQGELIADSDNIRAHFEAQGHDFDGGLDAGQRAVSRAFIRMAEEHIYFHQVHDRWMDDANWDAIRVQYFGFLPPIVRQLLPVKLRKNLRQMLHGQGIGRLSDAERLARVTLDLEAIAAQIGTQNFMFGDTATAADASVGTILGGVIAAPSPTRLSQPVANDQVLSAYVTRCAAAMG